jgi:hypothetical protein
MAITGAVIWSKNANSCKSNIFGSNYSSALRCVIYRCLPTFFDLAFSLSSTLPG